MTSLMTHKKKEAMTSLMTKDVIMFLCWMLITQSTATGDMSQNLLNFFSVWNGHFDNSHANQEGNKTLVKIEVRLKPVVVSAFEKEPMIYIEEAINGNINCMSVLRVSESIDGSCIFFTLYNFTDSTPYKPGEFKTKALDNFKREDFRSVDGCFSTFKQTRPGEFTGSSPDCNHGINGTYPMYMVTATCDGFDLHAPGESHEHSDVVPFIVKFTGSRYPLIGAPLNYASLCNSCQYDNTTALEGA